MNLTKGSVMLGQRPRFREFLAALAGRSVENEQQAAGVVRQYCGVASRRELNTDPQAADHYRELIRQFNHWMNGGQFGQESSQ